MNLSKPTRKIVKPRHRRGSVYLAVLGTSIITMILGLAALMAVRVEQQISANAKDAVQARLNARTSIETAFHVLQSTANWRNTFAHGLWTTLSFDDGTIAFKLVDEKDGILHGNTTQPVRLYGKGTVGNAVRIQSVLIEPPGGNMQQPMDLLGMAIHSALELKISGGQQLTIIGAPASTNVNFRIDGDLIGDVEASTQSGNGNVTGSTTIPAPFKNMPPATVFDNYVAKATTLAHNGDFEAMVLTPTVNEYGGSTNPDGVYYINTNGNNITIKHSRVHGTLVIDAGTKNVTIQNQVLMQPYRSDYPVLIVRGELHIQFNGDGQALDEVDINHNFNPPGAAYQGQSDADQLDVYPSEVQGLVHVIGLLQLNETSLVRGAIICEDTATIGGGGGTHEPMIIHDPNLTLSPPEGYATAAINAGMTMTPGTWQWETQ